MKWIDVYKKHKVVSALYFEDNKLISILFSGDRRRSRKNYEKEERIYIVINNEKRGRRGDIERGNKIIKYCRIGNIVKLFKKIAPDKWSNEGWHIIEDISVGKDDLARASITIVLHK